MYGVYLRAFLVENNLWFLVKKTLMTALDIKQISRVKAISLKILKPSIEPMGI